MKNAFFAKLNLRLIFTAILLTLTITTVALNYNSHIRKPVITTIIPISDNITSDNIFSQIEIPQSPVVGMTVVYISRTPVPTQSGSGNTNTPTPVLVITSTPEYTNTPTNTPVPTESLSAYVAFYSDPQSDTDAEDVNHQKVVNYILARGANPVFNAGDIMENGTADSLNRFNIVTATLRSSRTFYAALGNNDRAEGDASTPSPLFLDNFSFPGNERWYSVNVGNLHMVILDSAFASGSSAQKSWLAADLQSAASHDRITGVMFHHPSFASSISSYLIDYNVDFVIMGHNHAYQHYESNGINYFVSSGQPNMGYFVLRVYTTTATLTAYNQYNGVIATISFNNR